MGYGLDDEKTSSKLVEGLGGNGYVSTPFIIK
jgi:hypothetical protein